ncbi:MAG: hypothetical protein HY270_00415 [Deltaproteobacteria bacterium]|nr:hypothetical protein [Deltaproteobacteria bacterium]
MVAWRCRQKERNMRYICPKCEERFEVKPPSGICSHCDAPLVTENETRQSDPHGESEGSPPAKRHL